MNEVTKESNLIPIYGIYCIYNAKINMDELKNKLNDNLSFIMSPKNAI